MEPTNSMVRAAIQQAVELGLLPRHGAQNEYDWSLKKSIRRSAERTGKNRQCAAAEKEVLSAWQVSLAAN